MTMIANSKMTCPSCSHEQEATLYHSVNVSLNPELKPRVLQQELTRHRCAHCQETITLNYELLYNDMHKKLMVQLIMDDVAQRERVPPVLHDYRLRKVSSMQQLVEKVIIADSDLDDRVVEAMKDALCHTLAARASTTLAKLGAWPLNPDNLIFLEKSTMRLQTEGSSSSPEMREFLNFLLLLPVPHSMCAMNIIAPLTEYQQVQQKLTRHIGDDTGTGKWLRIDQRWAEQTMGTDVGPVDSQMMLSPEMLEKNPVAKAICDIHAQRVQAAMAASKAERKPGFLQGIKKWFSG